MKLSIERLENARRFVARCVIERPDGAAYIPICKELDRQLEELRGAESYMDRLRREAADWHKRAA